MTSKAQEREALEQIRKIVDGLGEGSYIGMALEGCLEMAQENIEWDFGDSPKLRWEAAEAKLEKAQAERDDLRGAYETVKTRLETEKGRTKEANDKLAYHIATEQALNTSLNEAMKAQREAQEMVEAQAQEIMRLKARLFDLLVK